MTGDIAHMLMTREPAPPIARHFLESLSFQLLGIMAGSVAVPLLLALSESNVLAQGGPFIIGSAIASFAAAVFALLIYRRVASFPGSRGFAYIMPAFAITYGVAATVLLGFRLPYSGLMLSAGFVSSLAFGFLAHYLAQRMARRQFYLVPFGNVGIMDEVEGIEWILMHEPSIPVDDRRGAIVADLRHDHAPEWERMLAEAAISGRVIYHTKQLRESLSGKVELEHLSENSFGSLLPNLAYRKIKRAFDIGIALVALPILSIPLLVLAVAIRMDSQGPALFRQTRMGYRGRPFQMVKFRTMQHAPESAGDARNSAMTQSSDQRVTRIGRFLRRTRIDELPQLVNVLRGEMSLIGPRPEALPLSQWYECELPFYRYRHIVRPGLTGWAQVNQGHVTDLDAVHKKLHYDFYYIKYFSAWLDALIIVRTIGIVFSGFGSK